MVSKVDEFNTVLLALDDSEVADILNALRHIGNDELACEIEEEVFGGCGECDCSEAVEPQLASLIFDIDTSALEVATVKMTAFADAAERAANEAERLEGALK